MLKINRVLFAAILMFSQFALLAQNNTNSPYTRYGYGELADRSFGAGRAMGGVGIGLRSNKQINPMNPASYTSTDSMTFIFDFGIAGQVSWFDDGINKQHQVNGNVEYIALQFPIARWLAFSAGILPYSHVGYSYGEVHTDETVYGELFNGTGGLNEVYAGVSIDIWKKRLSVGANVGYLFGNITHQQNTQFSSDANNSFQVKDVDVRDMKLDFGIQYTHPVSRTESFTFGATFSPKNNLNTKYTRLQQTTSTSSDTITSTGHAFDIPNSYGIGLSYQKENKVILAADFLFEEWSKARFFDSKDDFQNRYRVALGGEYLPDYQHRNLFKRSRYRAGIHYSNSYLKLKEFDNKSYNEFGASIGIGLPLLDSRSLINISFDYVKVKPDGRPLIDEQYFRFTVNYTFNERWFFKFKVD